MVGRVIEIETDGRHLAVNRGFMTVSERGSELGRIPLDDVAAVIANAHGLTYSNNVLVELVERGVPVVLCGRNHMPAGIVWPVESHHMQTGRMSDQVSASVPLRKRLWAQLVRAKILAQASTLEAVGASSTGFFLLSRRVRSGDPENVEAEAARRYWPLLFGEEFRRVRDAPGINGLLNYGYTVLRAGIARSVMAVGLHPGFGLMHSNRSNAMVLVDDLMEPFRPHVDREVHRLVRNGTTTVDRDAKAALARIMVIDLPTRVGLSPIMVCGERLAQSLARAFAGEGDALDLPLAAAPLEA